jgi:murein DD-endopeptidase MepM/ murein hydrolase activator NlpD
MKNAPLRALLAVWLLTGLACNLPTRARLIERQVEQGLQATLAAAGTATPEIPVTVSTENLPAPTAEPAQATPIPAQPTPMAVDDGTTWQYVTQAGDTLAGLQARFGVTPEQISAAAGLPGQGLIDPGIALSIPNPLGPAPYPQPVLPDSEIVYSPTAAGFDIGAFVAQAGGRLSEYQEQVDGETLTGTEIIRRVALENSINPRLLLALVEYQSGWVYGPGSDASRADYPIGFFLGDFRGLRKELSLAVRQLALGYYGWRAGTLTDLTFSNGTTARIDPRLNAGSVAAQYLFTKLYYEESWRNVLYGERSFPALYARMFGDPWAAAEAIGPLLPPGLTQPALELPFAPGERWSLTGGPHIAWGIGSALAAIDFAPITGEPKCAVSRAWVLASAPGVIVRAERGAVALDLDGDGSEATGWVILYMHVAAADRAAVGTRLNTNDPLGHPSCEGGAATGTHVHVARKFNGEWLAAGGPLPGVWSGWQALQGERPYLGFLVKGDRIVTAKPDGSSTSVIVRE